MPHPPATSDKVSQVAKLFPLQSSLKTIHRLLSCPPHESERTGHFVRNPSLATLKTHPGGAAVCAGSAAVCAMTHPPDPE